MADPIAIPTDPRWKDLTGNRFGRYLVIGYAGKPDGRIHRWLCRCDCGTERTVVRGSLINGDSRSCGCAKPEATRVAATRHGHAGRGRETGTWRSWRSAVYRCHDPKSISYPRYGAVGIFVCDVWRYSFETFLADMGERPAGTSIERIKSDRGYEPGNCRWATSKEQGRNQRTNKFVVVGGIEMIVSDALAITGVSRTTYYRRLKQGMTEQEALVS